MWWGLGLLAWHQGHGWMVVGPFLNSVCLAVATQMVEERMTKAAHRADVYKQYQKEVDCWIPFTNAKAAFQALLPAQAAAAVHRD